jgi:cell wall-associated NlpC family hydrolase
VRVPQRTQIRIVHHRRDGDTRARTRARAATRARATTRARAREKFNVLERERVRRGRARTALEERQHREQRAARGVPRAAREQQPRERGRRDADVVAIFRAQIVAVQRRRRPRARGCTAAAPRRDEEGDEVRVRDVHGLEQRVPARVRMQRGSAAGRRGPAPRAHRATQ